MFQLFSVSLVTLTQTEQGTRRDRALRKGVNNLTHIFQIG